MHSTSRFFIISLPVCRARHRQAFGVFVDGGAHGWGSNGKSAPMDGGYLLHETNTPAAGSRIQEKA